MKNINPKINHPMVKTSTFKFAVRLCGTLLFVFAMALSQASAQTTHKTFEITQHGTVTNVAPYEAALLQANFDTYRRADERRVLKFDNGLVVELLSAKELLYLGIKVNTADLDNSGGSPVRNSVFRLHPSGYILERVEAELPRE
jgi:hypothetical protein